METSSDPPSDADVAVAVASRRGEGTDSTIMGDGTVEEGGIVKTGRSSLLVCCKGTTVMDTAETGFDTSVETAGGGTTVALALSGPSFDDEIRGSTTKGGCEGAV